MSDLPLCQLKLTLNLSYIVGVFTRLKASFLLDTSMHQMRIWIELRGFRLVLWFRCCTSNHLTSRPVERDIRLSHQHLLPLVSTLASEIIPSLIKEHGLNAREEEGNTGSLKLVSQCQHQPVVEMSQRELAQFADECAQACLNMNAEELFDYSQALFKQGVDIEVFYLDIIPRAIKLFHDFWEKDQISFLDVTRGTWSVKRLLITLSPDFIRPDQGSMMQGSYKYQALVSLAQGAQHTLGPMLVSQYLERKGWHVVAGFDHEEKEILQLVAKNWIDLFCVSVSLSQDVPKLKALISKVRKRSKNSHIQCLVGGALMALEPKLMNELNADANCMNARDVHSMGLKLVRVHRKLRKLHLVSASELSSNLVSQGREIPRSHSSEALSSTLGTTESSRRRMSRASNQDELSPNFVSKGDFKSNKSSQG